MVETIKNILVTANAVAEILSAAGFSVAEKNRADNLRATDYLFRRARAV